MSVSISHHGIAGPQDSLQILNKKLRMVEKGGPPACEGWIALDRYEMLHRASGAGRAGAETDAGQP